MTSKYKAPRRGQFDDVPIGTLNFFNDYDEYIKLCKEYNHVTQNRWDVDKWQKHYLYLKYFDKGRNNILSNKKSYPS
jgi:hypothetical protein